MKILQLIQKPQLRGAEMFAAQLSQHLVELGNECVMVSIFEGEASLPFKGQFIELNRPLNKRFMDWAGWKQFAEIVKNDQPDIIQANAGDTLKFAVLSKLFFGWKTPIVFRNANKIGDFINSKPKYWLNKFLVDRLSHVISVSELCHQDFRKTFHFPQSKIDTGTIGVELKEVSGIPEDLVSIFQHHQVLVNVASLVPEKNHTALLRMLSELLKEQSPIHLLIIGKGRLQTQLLEQVNILGLQDAVAFLGYRNDVLEIVKAASVFVLPSHIEGLPGVILEAQYVNTPVVAYNVGGISEVVQNHQTGWLIEKNDEEAFKKAVLYILNPEHATTISQVTDNAHQQVINQYNNRTIALRFLEIYKKVQTPTSL